jgi:hypothetical protein
MMNIFTPLKDKVTQYIDVYLNLLKVNFVEKSSFILSYFIFSFIGLFIFLCFIFLLSFGLVETFIEVGASRLGAFFITSGIYFICLLILLGLRKPITKCIANMFIAMFTDPNDKK